MRYRRLASTGLKLSELSLGSWATIGDRLGLDETCGILRAAYEGGVNHFDTAEVYDGGRAEAALGEAIAALRWSRETFVITTKLMWGTKGDIPNTWGLSKKHLVEGCHASLRRLRLDHIDLLLCHRPDPDTPLEETVTAMGHLVAQGLVLYWGTSEWPTAMIEEALRLSAALGVAKPVVEQSQYNLFQRCRVEADFADASMAGIGICAWSPLLYGLLAGRRMGEPGQEMRLDRDGMGWLRETALPRDQINMRLSVIAAFEAIAAELGISPACAGLGWCLANARIASVITGASRAVHIEQNLKELARIDDFLALRHMLESRLEARGFQFDLAKDRFINV